MVAEVDAPQASRGRTQSNASTAANGTLNTGDVNGSAQPTKTGGPQNTTPPFPPPKTDKPRPHVCATCTRSFARLEHLKRHERSHTKEKPFECPQCTRCFARRDLLLRHQQKLHQQGAASTRPRNGRRESTTGMVTGARVRKNSVASSINSSVAGGPGGMRPRANTISHIDGAALNNLLASTNVSTGRGGGAVSGHSHHASLTGLTGAGAFDYRGLSTSMGNHGQANGLPKIDTHLGLGLGGGLRTAPIPGVPDDFDIDKFFANTGSTINPNQLHLNSFGDPSSPFFNYNNPFPGTTGLEEDDGFSWSAGLDASMMFNTGNENALDGSSPSAISTASQSGFSEVMIDGSGNPQSSSASMWHNPLVTHANLSHNAFTTLDTMGPIFPELMMNTMSPKDLQEQNASTDFYMPSPQPMSGMSPSTGTAGISNQYFHPLALNSDGNSISSPSINSSARHSSVTSVSTESITDATRQALIMNLSHAMGSSPNQRKYSQPHISSPLSSTNSGKPQSQFASLPSTMDLQRYVNAYIQYFHPHLPFLHIPTLSFDTPAYTYQMRTPGSFSQEGIIGGGGCLILAMAAIGALYEFEHKVAKELFEAAKKMILYYLDERRQRGLAAVNGRNAPQDHINKPPLWLIQAMMLNLIYGHNCGDKQAAEVASTHCAALVSLAKACGLDKPEVEVPSTDIFRQPTPNSLDGDIDMGDDGISPDLFSKHAQVDHLDEHAQWMKWKMVEERKRTYFAVFSMSSLLVSAYAHAPRILNSEIRLNLPCEEDLWAADNAQVWVTMGGPAAAQARGLSFNNAMTYLLEASVRKQANQRENHAYAQPFGSNMSTTEPTESEIKPSTFGCYVLINALHVYIWETRQRHTGRIWKTQETEAMHAQVEPALKAWQAAWRANPNHSIERPSPFGPLGADSIPLLDLAYVRLFVNLTRTKELLWLRDFDGMAGELAKGVEIVAHADSSVDGSSDPTDSTRTSNTSISSPRNTASPGDMDAIGEASPGQTANNLQPNQSSKRERHLRRAAFYAADSLSMADKLGATYAEFTARELPNSSAMCTMDCAQILAEWVATVQDRVGRYLGVLGKDDIDYSAVPAIMLLEEEDVKLLQKIQDILNHADLKLTFDITNMGSSAAMPIMSGLASLGPCGYGSKLLMVTAYMLEKAAVWPVTHVMARALEAHAAHVNRRAEASTLIK
ncbi:uncharacterized protein BDZ99DRAFT_10388 [Mytilinidion resinicola]|uniref:C2H2-type domain-containing protein n=1 Tax=Mytilinidion resinicola TaxID=574789 RepID=A0A6A6ZA58_9PEZI|nr:uncharacterized protein BDZ99DRAFT_10388 [Mytilinidion resinicola]KAF2817165.1 hypothetical protein BDZ99DRAFT_10388 [Mytilinidion resinicola]